MTPFIVSICSALLLLTALPAGGQELGVESNLPPDGYVDPGTPIELRFSRPLDGERVAVFVGTTDVSDLFRLTAGGMRSEPQPLPLTAGEHEVVVYRVGADGAWSELMRTPLRVRTRAGFDRTRLDPGLTLGLEGPLGLGQHPAEPPLGRETRQDLTGQLQLEAELERDGSRFIGTAAVVGNSDRATALRFREMGQDAPRVDLSSFRVQLARERGSLSAGHVGHGDQRHLISGFDSRGTLLALNPHPRLSASAAVLNGSRVVGWSNLLGLERPEHRILSGAVGVELLPRSGALRVELTGMDGSVLPLSGFNQGAIVDAETSRGMAARLRASTAGRRLTLDAGLARSAFTNPPDPSLAQEDVLVPVETETRSARFLEASAGLLQALPLGGGRRASLALGYRHERVDPLYRSVAAYTRSDVLRNTLDLRANLAGLGVRVSWTGSENNLDRIPSILTTRTHRPALDASLPLATFLGVRGGAGGWLPTLRYGMDRTHQFGLGVPVDGGFDESHVPDQLSVNQTAAADWSWGRVNLGYQLGHVHQDNRQPGREEADFTTRTDAVSLGLALHARLSLNLALGREHAERHEAGESDRTRRYGGGVSWTPVQRSTLSMNLSSTRAAAGGGMRQQDNRQLDAQWAAVVPWLRAFGGTYFLRFSHAAAETVDRAFELDQRRENWSVNSGLTFTF